MNTSETPGKSPWLKSAIADSCFILLPPFLSLFVVILFPDHFKTTSAMPVQYWIVLVVFVDVAHVYSTLYRTYFKRQQNKRLSSLLTIIPLCCYFSGVILYHIEALLFWRILAYLAVYHFIRQQYGFMRLYARNEKTGKLSGSIDQAMIYSATIYPLLFWHFDGNRNFSWFINGDFISYPSVFLTSVSGGLYLMIISLYLIKESLLVWRTKYFNVPRNVLIIGTCLSWYFGIVYFNGDMAFTTLNVLSHGIPYMALIWFFEKDQHLSLGRPEQNIGRRWSYISYLRKLSFSRYGVVLFIVVIVFFAYIEEGLWDGLIWKEHQNIFQIFSFLPVLTETDILAFVVPLLALPQATHYVLDGFIWRKRGQSFNSVNSRKHVQ